MQGVWENIRIRLLFGVLWRSSFERCGMRKDQMVWLCPWASEFSGMGALRQFQKTFPSVALRISFSIRKVSEICEAQRDAGRCRVPYHALMWTWNITRQTWKVISGKARAKKIWLPFRIPALEDPAFGFVICFVIISPGLSSPFPDGLLPKKHGRLETHLITSCLTSNKVSSPE